MSLCFQLLKSLRRYFLPNGFDHTWSHLCLSQVPESGERKTGRLTRQCQFAWWRVLEHQL